MLDTGHAWDTFACVSWPCPLKKNLRVTGGTQEQEESNTLSQNKESIISNSNSTFEN